VLNPQGRFWAEIIPVWEGPTQDISLSGLQGGARDWPKSQRRIGALYLTTVDEVERRSGLDFFRQLPDTEEDPMEAAKDLAWAQSWVN
jgi:hypothetical protein